VRYTWTVPLSPRRRASEGRRAALGALASVLSLSCAAAPMTLMPVPRSAETAPSSTSAPVLAPLAPRAIEADFVIDSSTTVKASLDEIHAMLLADGSLTHVLPYTRSAALLRAPEGAERHVTLVQGTSMINVEYTLRIEDAGDVVHFRLEKDHPHGIADCEGFFELTAEAPDRTKVRFVDAVDLGKGVARFLFKEQIRKSASTTPTLVQKYMESGQSTSAPPPNPDQ
jgi:hypothetical protein